MRVLEYSACNSLNQGCCKISHAAKRNRAWHTVGAGSLLVPLLTPEECFRKHEEQEGMEKGHSSSGWGRDGLHSSLVSERAAGSVGLPPGQWEGKEGYFPAVASDRAWGWPGIPNPSKRQSRRSQPREAYPKGPLDHGCQEEERVKNVGVREQSSLQWVKGREVAWINTRIGAKTASLNHILPGYLH